MFVLLILSGPTPLPSSNPSGTPEQVRMKLTNLHVSGPNGFSTIGWFNPTLHLQLDPGYGPVNLEDIQLSSGTREEESTTSPSKACLESPEDTYGNRAGTPRPHLILTHGVVGCCDLSVSQSSFSPGDSFNTIQPMLLLEKPHAGQVDTALVSGALTCRQIFPDDTSLQ